MSEPAEEKIARLTRERDEMATQATACAEEVDRVRVEIGAVQAEVERLRDRLEERAAERDVARKANRNLRAALAESERKRVEAASAGRMLIAAEDARRTAIAAFNVAWDEQPAPPTQKQVSAERAAIQGADIAHQRALLRALAAIRALATPTQETSHVES